MSAFEANRRLRRTMNMGMALDAPTEGEWGLVITAEHVAACARAGFSALRLPVQWAERMDRAAPYAIAQEALARVTALAEQARAAGMAIIITNHPDERLMASPGQEAGRLFALWEQLGNHFAGWSDEDIFFEPLSEPHGALEAEWNPMLAQLLRVIRKHNPTRPVIIGGVGFNRADRLSALVLPHDERVIVTFHWYLPIDFTMQGEEYLKDLVPLETIRGWVGNTWDESAAEFAKAQAVFGAVADFSKAHDVPVFLGEFGVSDRADGTSKTRWIRAHRKLAEQHGFSWGYWSFGAAFSAYDVSGGAWRPEVLAALVED